ncbi:hypothetical protein M2451_002463 [Dysgonomonas sp. PFB1-18]|nr:hypothetical protein [Dysgonomonas sp. PF1-14]MDH6337148.1 hypothetical protein [Dysgonomonas sp. PF1-16]MDH6381134.1 hypothetical protein [Dysgonomonas sp. PFB1-18]MDH6396286.1 hypothetical protein [Dysgonomonas sp. PF1-23]
MTARLSVDICKQARISFNLLDLASWVPVFWPTGLLYNNQYEKKLKK